MTNTIPNVPRELLERARAAVASTNTSNWSSDLLRDIHAILSAPSPAGADGLEVVGWYRMDDRKAITPYPSVCATWHKMGVKVGAAYSDSAQAIIDGLRGEVADLRSMLATVSQAGLRVRTERDQQAQRIGELEGLLREVHGWIDESARVYRHNSTSVMLYRIDAALSAVCAAAPNIATTSEHSGS